MIALRSHRDGVVLPVKAQPGARASGIQGEHDGMLKVSVTQVAERGKANKALAAVLAETLDLRKSQVELLSGETAAQKQFLIHNLTIEQLQAKLRSLGASA